MTDRYGIAEWFGEPFIRMSIRLSASPAFRRRYR